MPTCLAIDFDVYLIDEVTEVGDQRFRRKCAEAFRERMLRSDIILVTHNPHTLRQYCDRGAILANGELTCTTTSAPRSVDTIAWCRKVSDGGTDNVSASDPPAGRAPRPSAEEFKRAIVAPTSAAVLPAPAEGGGKIAAFSQPTEAGGRNAAAGVCPSVWFSFV